MSDTFGEHSRRLHFLCCHLHFTLLTLSKMIVVAPEILAAIFKILRNNREAAYDQDKANRSYCKSLHSSLLVCVLWHQVAKVELMHTISVKYCSTASALLEKLTKPGTVMTSWLRKLVVDGTTQTAATHLSTLSRKTMNSILQACLNLESLAIIGINRWDPADILTTSLTGLFLLCTLFLHKD